LSKAQYMKASTAQLQRPDASMLAAYDAAFSKLSQAIAGRGGKLLLVGSNATIETLPACAKPEWFNRIQTRPCQAGIAVAGDRTVQFEAALDAHMAEVFDRNPNLQIVSIMDRLCDVKSGRCQTTDNGHYLYVDDSHLTTRAVDLVAKDLEVAMRRLM
jgi:hypothetical protein